VKIAKQMFAGILILIGVILLFSTVREFYSAVIVQKVSFFKIAIPLIAFLVAALFILTTAIRMLKKSR
jgi:hypothetical protein